LQCVAVNAVEDERLVAVCCSECSRG